MSSIEKKKWYVILQENWDEIIDNHEYTFWDKFIDLIPWQITYSFWKFKVVIGIIFNPSKLWHLPEFINNMNLLTYHEKWSHNQLKPEEIDDKGYCKKHGCNHLLVFEEYKEILGPFYVE